MRKSARRKSARNRWLTLGAAVLSALAALLFSPPQPPATFQEAKKAAWAIHADNPVTFYCGCRYQGNRVDLASCGYQPRKNRQRASRIEWEHVVPAWVIGHQRQCWKQGGRDNCSANDPVFARAEADLHNLVPAIGEVNGDRSNFPFAMLPGKPHQYGRCEVVIDFKKRQVMPREEIRGAIARTYLYMHERYQLRMSKRDRQLYDAWNRMYPVTEQERRRNQAVACEMGWGNPYVGEVERWRCGFGRLGDVAADALGLVREVPLEQLGAAVGTLLKR